MAQWGNKAERAMGVAIAIGIVLGAAVSLLSGDAIWLAVGVTIGCGLGATLHAAQTKRDRQGPGPGGPPEAGPQPRP